MEKPKVKNGQIDFVLFATIMLLVAVGVVMVYSASSYYAFFSKISDATFFLKKQLIFSTIGTFFMVLAIRTDYHILKKYTKILMFITVILLVVVLFSKPINGAKRWIDFKVITLQPSEIAKYVIVLYLAMSIERKGEKIKTFLGGILPYLMVSGFFAGMVLMEKNLSIASVIMIVTVIILFASGARMSHLIGLGTFLVGLVAAFTVLEPYRMDRLMNFRNPWIDPRGKGYQLIQSLYALASGGIFGVGIGQSRQKCFYIPEPHNDFIFSVIGEEVGLIGCILIISLYLIFIWRGIRTAVRAKDVYGTIIAVGITSVVAVQAIINIAVVSGSMPVTGVPLPFISYGGSALVINMFAMGILLNVSRQINK